MLCADERNDIVYYQIEGRILKRSTTRRKFPWINIGENEALVSDSAE